MSSAGTAGSFSALAAAPSTGEYSKQPTRSSCATRSQSSSSSKSCVGFAGETHDEGAANGDVRDHAPPCGDALQGVVRRGGTLHQFQDAGAGVLKGNVQIGQYLALRHEFDHLIDVRIGIDIVQANPDAQFAERRGQVVEAGAALHIAPRLRGVFQIDAVGAGVLGNHQDLLHAGAHQLLGFAQHLADRAG